MPSGVLFGVGFVGVVVVLSQRLGVQRRLAMFALLLGAAAAVYVGADLGEQTGSAAMATAAFVLFGGIALWGWEHFLVLAAGWLAHAVWDLLHLLEVFTSAAPQWYQVACLVADPLLAAYLVYEAMAGMRSMDPGRTTGEHDRA